MFVCGWSCVCCCVRPCLLGCSFADGNVATQVFVWAEEGGADNTFRHVACGCPYESCCVSCPASGAGTARGKKPPVATRENQQSPCDTHERERAHGMHRQQAIPAARVTHDDDDDDDLLQACAQRTVPPPPPQCQQR
jgi:hypothetical protein